MVTDSDGSSTVITGNGRGSSADARVSRDFKVNPKYTVRLSLSGFNLTNHFNPEAVHNNTGDPLYGLCFGHRGRRFTGDFDVLF